MIWVKILRGNNKKSSITFSVTYHIIKFFIIFPKQLLFSLNQSLQWPFREIYGTAIFDFEPQGTNQLQLKAGCQVLIIGKDGDDRGWWRGKVGDVVSSTWKYFFFFIQKQKKKEKQWVFDTILGWLLSQRVRTNATTD